MEIQESDVQKIYSVGVFSTYGKIPKMARRNVTIEELEKLIEIVTEQPCL